VVDGKKNDIYKATAQNMYNIKYVGGEAHFSVHFTYKIPWWISIKFDNEGLEEMLSVSVNITSIFKLHSEATSARKRQEQSHKLVVNNEVCGTVSFFFVFYFFAT
jgi:hypothetical protein